MIGGFQSLYCPMMRYLRSTNKPCEDVVDKVSKESVSILFNIRSPLLMEKLSLISLYELNREIFHEA